MAKDNYTSTYFAGKEFAIERMGWDGAGFSRALRPPSAIAFRRWHEEREPLPLAGP